MSFAQALKAKDNRTIYLLTAPAAGGHPAWWFVRVEPAKVQQYLKMSARGSIHIPDYGEVLESGFGKSPPPEVIEEIKQRYNLPNDAFTSFA